MKKIISIILALIFALSSMTTLAYAEEKCDCGRNPILYVRGKGSIHTIDENGEPVDDGLLKVPTDYIKENAAKLFAAYEYGYFTNDFSKFGDEVAKAVKVAYSGISPTKDGTLPENTGIWPPTPFEGRGEIHKGDIPTDAEKCRMYYVNAYEFRMDYRKSLDENADNLKKQVEALKKATKHDKITIIGRCMGTAVVTTYLTKYGYDSIGSVILYNAGCNGAEFVDTCFTGNYKIEGENLQTFFDRISSDNALVSDDVVLSILSYIFSTFSSKYAMVLTAETAGKIFENCAKQITPQIERECLGLFPGYWSMLSADKFDEAMEYIFPGEYKKEYKAIIDKLTFDHDNYLVNIEKTLKEGKKLGVPIHIVAKYNFSAYPIFEESKENSDLFISTKKQSFGATLTQIGETFSDEYIENSKKNDTYKYISPDKTVDASTALFPETTWFVKDDPHDTYPDETEAMFVYIALDPTVTVFTSDKYSQYLVYSKDENGKHLESQTEENLGVVVKDKKGIEKVFDIISKFFTMWKTIFSKLFSK